MCAAAEHDYGKADHLRQARSTLLSGHDENEQRQIRWASSPSATTATTQLHLLESSPMTAFNPFSGDESDLRTTRSPRVSRAGASEEENLNSMGASSRFASPEKVQELKEQLQRTARRIKKLEHEAEEGSRALDVANVKLAEKLLLCSTLSAKLLWPDETGFDAANALDALDTLTEDTTCTVDPFVETRRSSSSQWCTAPLKEILPNDPIESLSPSGS